MYQHEKDKKRALEAIKASDLHHDAIKWLSDQWRPLKELNAFPRHSHAYTVFMDLVFAGIADCKIVPASISAGRGWGCNFFFKLGTGEHKPCSCLGMLISIPGLGGRYVEGEHQKYNY